MKMTKMLVVLLGAGFAVGCGGDDLSSVQAQITSATSGFDATCPAPYYARFALELKGLTEDAASQPVVERLQVIRNGDDALLIDMPSGDITIDRQSAPSAVTLKGEGRSISETPGSGDGVYKTRMEITIRLGDGTRTLTSQAFDSGWGHINCQP
ncbi:MAG: hypothetical protein KC503_14385 [Myxococcales bacterium]|nr:hypothetical protein [Myxococcales bacterium]